MTFQVTYYFNLYSFKSHFLAFKLQSYFIVALVTLSSKVCAKLICCFHLVCGLLDSIAFIHSSRNINCYIIVLSLITEQVKTLHIHALHIISIRIWHNICTNFVFMGLKLSLHSSFVGKIPNNILRVMLFTFFSCWTTFNAF